MKFSWFKFLTSAVFILTVARIFAWIIIGIMIHPLPLPAWLATYGAIFILSIFHYQTPEGDNDNDPRNAPRS